MEDASKGQRAGRRADRPGRAESIGKTLIERLRAGRSAILKKSVLSALLSREHERDKAEAILSSGLFDAEWYAASTPGTASSGLKPVLHYLRVGGPQGLPPSPHFDAADYLARYPDVAAAGANPLLHYISFGRQEGRLVRPLRGATAAESRDDAAANAPSGGAGDEALALIEQSPLFDKAWYSAKYPEVGSSGLTPAQHYLQSDPRELRRPSLLFDPQFYVIEQSPEIQFTATNPLLHYLTVGRALGRKPRALFLVTPTPGMEKPLEAGAWPLTVDGAADSCAWDEWLSLDEAARLAGAVALRVADTIIAVTDAPDGVMPHLRRAAAFAMLIGHDPDAAISVSPAGAVPAPDTASDVDRMTAIGPVLANGRHRLADLWYSAGTVLRLRIGDGTAGTDHERALLRIFGVGSAGSNPVLLAEAPLTGSPAAFADVPLTHPLMPLLIVLSSMDGRLIDTALLPFPSLCRSGLHHAELAGLDACPDPLTALQALSSRAIRNLIAARASPDGFLVAALAADVRGAAGSEPLFQPDMRYWLAAVFGLSAGAAPAGTTLSAGEDWLRAELSGGALTRRGRARLVLPADSIPTIAVLTAPAPRGAASAAASPYFVADPLGGRPLLSAVLPAPLDELDALQPDGMPRAFPLLLPDGGDSSAPPLAPHIHAAIRFPSSYEENRSIALMPMSPDSAGRVIASAGGSAVPEVDAYLRASDVLRLKHLVAALLAQTEVAISAITVELSGDHPDEPAFSAFCDSLPPGRIMLVRPRHPAPLSRLTCRASAPAPLTLIASDSIILHDRRTLSVLAALMNRGTVASASCMILRESPARRSPQAGFESGGLFPSHVSFFAAPRLILAEPDLRGAFGTASYPVIANTAGLVLAATGSLARYGAESDPPDGVGFALRAAAAGYRHYCTGAVRAVFTGSASRTVINDPPGLDTIGPSDWAGILGSAAMIREIA